MLAFFAVVYCPKHMYMHSVLRTMPMKKWSESCSVVSNSLQPHRLYSPWNSLSQNIGTGSLSLLQGIFPTQESNQGLLHCRKILCQLSHKGSPGVSIFPSKSTDFKLSVSNVVYFSLFVDEKTEPWDALGAISPTVLQPLWPCFNLLKLQLFLPLHRY